MQRFGQITNWRSPGEKFDELTAHLLQATKLTTEMAVRDAGLKWSQISRVVLVGGSTHMPAVREMLKKLSGQPPDIGVNPVVAVSLGAAIYAHLLETGTAMKAIQHKAGPELPDDAQGKTPKVAAAPPPRGATAAPSAPPLRSPSAFPPLPRVSFVTAHGVGVKTLLPTGWANKVLIHKNTRVPCRATKRFLTRAKGKGGSQIKVDITQGDTPDVALAEQLGTGVISGVPAEEPQGQPVDVTMEFDAQGRLHVSALYVPRNLQMQLSVEIPGGLRPEEVAQHRRFLEETGFLPSSASATAPPRPGDANDCLAGQR